LAVAHLQLSIKPFTYLLNKLLLLKYLPRLKWHHRKLIRSMQKLGSIKSCFTRTSSEFINFTRTMRKFISLWNIAKTENFLPLLMRTALWVKHTLAKSLNISCRRWNTWNLKEFFTGISNVRISCSIKTGMSNLLTLALRPINNLVPSVKLFVALLHLLLLKC